MQVSALPPACCINNVESSFCCSFPEESLTPKFHVMIFEHQRMMQKYFMCGMTTEEFIEVLHRDENEHKRLVRHMHDAGHSAFICLSIPLCSVHQGSLFVSMFVSIHSSLVSLRLIYCSVQRSAWRPKQGTSATDKSQKSALLFKNERASATFLVSEVQNSKKKKRRKKGLKFEMI